MPESRTPPLSALIAYVDGASRGNPGPASYGVVIQDATGATVDTLSEYLGQATNNVAEYRALLAALRYAASNGAKELKIFCDSELVARQMQGRYRVQSPDLKPLFEQARELSRRFERFKIEHVLRHRNQQADELANQALDQALKSKSRSSATPAPARAARESSFLAVAESGRLRPITSDIVLEEGAQYEVRVVKRVAASR
jgi:ribonuclease HI